MIPLISLERTRQILTPYVGSMLRSLREAVDEWNTGLAPYHIALDAAARAMILNRLFYFNAARNMAGVEFREDQLQRYIVVSDEILVRAKLFDSRLERRNYPTAHAREWVQQATLPGIPPLSRLHFGYRLDVTGTIIKDAFVTLPNGNLFTINDWVWQIYGEPVEAFGLQPSLFNRVVFQYDDFSQAI